MYDEKAIFQLDSLLGGHTLFTRFGAEYQTENCTWRKHISVIF